MKALNAFQRVMDVILRWICILLFAALVILVVYQVVIRSFGGGNAWTEALARIVFIWQGIIGAAYVIGENDDVAIDFLVRKFPAAVVKLFEVLAHSIVAGFAIWVMIWGGWELASSAFDQTVELLPFSQGQIYLILPVAGLLITIYCLLHIVTTITGEVKEIVPEEEIDIATLQEEGI
ncbi:TRAP transporter small permease [Propionimicrobium sp. PCR01-08-3]|uniref:TRAP transporter small permease n=1 Tax=Propionimicrobium sp. PCR01-08-3 TaxID=3052086 RepID=UPI00255C574A|nr:TRAP transporter small permease [Propionimicrobium sp. PCR01-08-3]WIY82548.1 TRAP transporter small permease [Propionimicrobium sp. PCR01-08-3]